MNLTDQERKKLLEFLGYGRLDAPLWFLGMEEGIGGQAGMATLEQSIKTRAHYFKNVEDLAQSHLLFNYDLTAQRTFTQVWVWMAKLARAVLHRAADWQDVEKARIYIQQELGRFDGETFLTELLPLPSPSIDQWMYKEWFLARADYEKHVITARQQKLRELITEHQPRFLFAYGKGYHAYYRAIFDKGEWQPVPDTSSTIDVLEYHNTTVILMPFFGQGSLGMKDAQILIDYLATLRRD